MLVHVASMRRHPCRAAVAQESCDASGCMRQAASTHLVLPSSATASLSCEDALSSSLRVCDSCRASSALRPCSSLISAPPAASATPPSTAPRGAACCRGARFSLAPAGIGGEVDGGRWGRPGGPSDKRRQERGMPAIASDASQRNESLQ